MTRGRTAFAFLTAASAWLLIGAGGLVTSSGSGLSIPDWPLAYGRIVPPLVGGIRIEFAHRVIAGVVAVMTGVLMVWTLQTERRLWIRRLSIAAFAAVLVQAALGGLTVLFLLPTAVSIAHAGLAELFLGCLVVLAAATAAQTSVEKTADSTLLRCAVAVPVLIFIQIMFGAWTRHIGAGLAIPDFPLAYGQLIPPLSSDALPEINRELFEKHSLEYLSSTAPIAVHFMHRLGALAVSAAVLIFLIASLRRSSLDRKLVAVSAALTALLAAQIGLAAWTIWSKLSVWPTTAHVSVGSAMFALSVYGAADCFFCYRKEAYA